MLPLNLDLPIFCRSARAATPLQFGCELRQLLFRQHEPNSDSDRFPFATFAIEADAYRLLLGGLTARNGAFRDLAEPPRLVGVAAIDESGVWPFHPLSVRRRTNWNLPCFRPLKPKAVCDEFAIADECARKVVIQAKQVEEHLPR